MATAVTRSTIEGWFKQKYGEVERAVPSFAVLQQRVKFSERDRLGDFYNFPVFLSRSHGITLNGSSPGTAFTLNEAESPVSKNAQVQGTEFVLREKVAYGTLSAARKAGDEAFGNAMSEIVLNMKEAASFYLEAFMLYGQTDFGIVQGRSDDSGTTQTFQLTKASWAAGLWSQMLNGYVDVFETGFATHRNSSGTCKVTAIDPDERTVTLTGTEAEMDTIVATDVIVPRGHTSDTTPTFEVFAGLDKIATNTGTLFSISASTYNLWKAATYPVGSAKATMGKIQAAMAKAVVRGLMEDVQVLVSTYTWIDLMNDLSALRRYADDTRQEMTLGTTSITFYGANGGKMEIIPHAMVKAGEGFIVPLKHLKRIGSTDTTFKIPSASGQNENMYTDLADAAGAQLRCYWDQAIIHTCPARIVKLTGIVNASLPDATSET